MPKIRIAVVGLGNCASSLIQGITYYRDHDSENPIGLMHRLIGPYAASDLELAAVFDIDSRKVGLDAAEAAFAPPNCTAVFQPDLAPTGVKVTMGRILDGVSDHMLAHDPAETFQPAAAPEPDPKKVVAVLKDSGSELMLNYLPVGSERASRFYAECALEAGVGLINCIPVFIASDPAWADRFKEKGLPIIGDDVKSQLGATIVHRTLTDLFAKRGVKLERTYQLNTGGNTDFLNMLNRDRLAAKKKSKTEAVQSAAAQRLADNDIHVGPSDYVAWQKDNKVCFIRMEGALFGQVPMNLELRLSVEDSPNSAGVTIDAVRCAKLALDRGRGGALIGPASYFMKHPPRQYPDDQAYRLTEEFIAGDQ